ncbi:MAG: hypothetical protein JNJ54_22290 [Myxococcaceae bacterium]|nr:hypothetical protein [Myxococcaceae bacterium]
MLPSLLALALAAGPVSVQFEGPLKQGLSAIAEKGGLNVIVVGELAEPAQIHLTDVTAEEALETVAKVYQLEVTKQGKLYVLRRATANAQAAPAPAAAAPSPPPVAPSLVINTTPGKDQTSPEVKQLLTEVEKLEAEQRRLEHETERLADEAERREELAAERDEKLNELVEKKVEHDKVLGRVKGEAVSAGSPVVIAAGEAVKDAVAYGGPVVVESGARVTGDAVAFGGDVVLKDRAIVEGDAVSFGGRVVREGNATVKGEEVSFGGSGIVSSMAAHAAKASNATSAHEDDKSGGLSIAAFLVQFVVFFVFGFLLMVFAPQRMKGLESAVRSQPVLSGVVGFLALVVALPLTVFLLITLIGIPVAALLWLALAFVVPMGLAAIANAVGTAMPLGRVRRTQAMVLAVGLFALLLVAQVPVMGPLVLSLAVCVSLGAVLRTRLGATPKGLPVTESVERLHG